MILMREKCTSSRSRDRHGLFFMNKQRMCVLALSEVEKEFIGTLSKKCIEGNRIEVVTQVTHNVLKTFYLVPNLS